MSTANDSRNSTITGEAYDLLDRFVAGLDEIIYDIAESLATARGNVVNGVVEITPEDVQEAARRVVESIRKQAGMAIPAEVAERMHQCVIEKCGIHKAGE